MVRSSMLESLTTSSAATAATAASAASGVEPAPGATEVIEAPTAEAAIAAVHAALGADARIIDARRVLRGGIGGFFAKEVVQLHAAPASAGSAVPAVPVRSPVPPADASLATPISAADRGAVSFAGPWGAVLRSESGRAADSELPGPAASPVDRLLDSASEVPDAVDFATFLRHRLEEDGEVLTGTTGTDPEPRAADDAIDPATFAAGAVTAWSPAPGDPDAVFVRGLPVPLETPPAAADGLGLPDRADLPRAPEVDDAPGPVEMTVAPVSCEPSPATDGGPAWSVGVLLQLGLPVELVRSLEVAQPADDLAWTNALAEALRPSCRPLPAGPAVMLGPNAHLIGEVEGIPAARSETGLKALRGGRWLHLVVGGDGWRAPLADQPLAASWARPEDLPDALRCAVELGLVLGFGPLGGRIRRARPLDVALAVRDLVDGR